MANRRIWLLGLRDTASGSDRYRVLMPSILLAALLCLLVPIELHASQCNRAMTGPVAHVPLPGSPFAALPTTDGCWVFVSLAAGVPAVAVLARADGVVTLKRIVRLPGLPTGMALTHDGSLLIVADVNDVVFLDVRRLTTGGGNPILGAWTEGQGGPKSVYVSVTADDRSLLVSNESIGTISVIDLQQTRRARFAHVQVVGSIPVGPGPIGLAFSSNQRFAFATVEFASLGGRSDRCRPEEDPTALPSRPEGAIVVIDMKVATYNPGASVVRRVSAGCSPVRVVTSPETGRVYVTARGSNELLVFSERGLTGFKSHPRATRVAVGASPIGVATIDSGREVVVTNSNPFNSGTTAPCLYVMDSARMAVHSPAMLGVIPSRGFPREIRVTTDGRTLLVTNFTAGSLEIVDLPRELRKDVPSIGLQAAAAARSRRPNVLGWCRRSCVTRGRGGRACRCARAPWLRLISLEPSGPPGAAERPLYIPERDPGNACRWQMGWSAPARVTCLTLGTRAVFPSAVRVQQRRLLNTVQGQKCAEWQ